MEKTNEKKKEIEEFTDELKLFIETLMEKGGASKLETEQIVTLYAIYKKNGRAEKLNGNGYRKKSNPNVPATDKQKKALLSFIGRGQISRVDVEDLTKGEASKLLDKAFGKRGFGPSSSALPRTTIPNLYDTENIPVEEKIIYQRWELPSVGFYWLIAEYDPEKELAFGYANLNNDSYAEWGYISIKEIKENGAILTDWWVPTKFKNINLDGKTFDLIPSM